MSDLLEMILRASRIFSYESELSPSIKHLREGRCRRGKGTLAIYFIDAAINIIFPWPAIFLSGEIFDF